VRQHDLLNACGLRRAPTPPALRFVPRLSNTTELEMVGARGFEPPTPAPHLTRRVRRGARAVLREHDYSRLQRLTNLESLTGLAGKGGQQGRVGVRAVDGARTNARSATDPRRSRFDGQRIAWRNKAPKAFSSMSESARTLM